MEGAVWGRSLDFTTDGDTLQSSDASGEVLFWTMGSQTLVGGLLTSG